MEQFEYIRWYWRYMDDETPVVLFYEVDLQNERYATRMTEVFPDGSAEPITELGFGFVTEAPVPPVEEINSDADFFAEIITKEVFEAAFRSQTYSEPLSFPRTS